MTDKCRPLIGKCPCCKQEIALTRIGAKELKLINHRVPKAMVDAGEESRCRCSNHRYDIDEQDIYLLPRD